eukprot:11960066-Karenia_brevis.AAC.1
MVDSICTAASRGHMSFPFVICGACKSVHKDVAKWLFVHFLPSHKACMYHDFYKHPVADDKPIPRQWLALPSYVLAA